jgi:hypothetical protein
MTMKKMNLYTLIGILVVLGSLLGACSANLERNPDGSLKLETTMQEGSLQDEIAIAIADPLMRDFSVELHAGYITVGAERGRAVGDKTDTVQFRLDLGVQDGHLTAVISDARLNDDPLDEAYVDVWNERMATQLERSGKQNANSSLQAVEVTSESLTMVWRIETWRSRE